MQPAGGLPSIEPAKVARVGEVLWELPASARAGMRVPARVLADEPLLEQLARDRSLAQLANVATLPGIVRAAYGMPDLHEGYGFPVGGVAAMDLADGVVSPGGIGFDIHCGVRLLVSELTAADVAPVLEPIVHELSRRVPAGFGERGRSLTLDDDELACVLERGVPWLVRERGLGTEDDLERIESGGRLLGAQLARVSERARERGLWQLGTLGGGNHFLEVQVVDAVDDEAIASALGLSLGLVTVLVHTGSRGFGHQVCTDYVRLMDRTMARHGLAVPDRQLACAPLASTEGRDYLAALACAANFAASNRQVIAERAREVFRRFFGDAGLLRLVYDVAHNTAKLERHDGRIVCVHRKGAIRAFGPSSDELPDALRGLGQPMFVPGSMGTRSHVLVGTDEAREVSFASACHGAGRAMSRSQAKRTTTGAEVRRGLAAQGIVVRCASDAELAEEAPLAYKDDARVIDVVVRAGIARKVARLRPLGVLKG